MPFDFTGQTALVTGATRGIGRQLAEDLARAGARVIATGTDPDVAAALQARGRADARDHRFLAVDFSDEAATTRFIEALDEIPQIDICVNNAGINRIRPIGETDLADWHRIQRVNLEAPLRIITCLAPRMAARGYGRIVNIASIFGVISKPERALYSMSKFGVRGLTIAAALELAPSNVLVNTVSPGFVRTELTDRILGPAEQDALRRQVPMQRFAEPADISSAVLFLASRDNTYITAQNVIVDGGFTNS
jgi:NAD(P)-dependent dehydrogenase (short-subunit alcohol dehydrogenase family)